MLVTLSTNMNDGNIISETLEVRKILKINSNRQQVIQLSYIQKFKLWFPPPLPPKYPK